MHNWLDEDSKPELQPQDEMDVDQMREAANRTKSTKTVSCEELLGTLRTAMHTKHANISNIKYGGTVSSKLVK